MRVTRIFKTLTGGQLMGGILLLSVLAPAAYAEISKSLEFIPANVDFGMIREENGMVSRRVKAVNISPDTTFIISARTSCGCSAAEYSNAMLAPGDTTEVVLTYDPANRPGKFLKTVRFFTGEERIGNSIKMNGNVIPSRTNLDRTYPDEAGPLRMSSRLLTAGEISRKEARPLFVGLYNDSDRPIPLLAETDHSALEAALIPDTIEPFGVASLSLMLKGRLIPEKTIDFIYKSFIIDAQSGDTITAIPVGGIAKP